MKAKLILSTATLAMGMLFASCNKNSTNVTPDSNSGTANGANMSYAMKAGNTSGSIGQKGTANGVITWTSGFANPTFVKFEAKQKGTEIEYKSTNTTQIDLFAPVATSFGGFVLPDGTYKEIELMIHLDNNGSSPAIQLTGSYAINLVTVPVVFSTDRALELKTEVKDVTIDNSSTFMAVTTLDLGSISDGITQTMLQNATLTNGTLVISSTSNRSLYNIIVNNLTSKRHHEEYEHHHH